MKQLIITFTALVLSYTTFAQAYAEKRTDNRTIKFAAPVTSIVLNNGVNLVLIDDITNDVFIEGRTGFVQSVDVSFKDGELSISGTEEHKEKPVAVFVCARFLKSILVNGNSIVGSYQTLKNNGLNITINGDCKVMIRSLGKVNVTATNDYTFTYQSNKIKN
jgi:hypothetical protein